MEIERKWLLEGDPFEIVQEAGVEILKSGYVVQAYLYDADGSSIRVRMNDWAVKNGAYDEQTEWEHFLTVKTPVDDLTRTELEIPISRHLWESIMADEAIGEEIHKARWVARLDDVLVAEIDVFFGAHDGLVVVEVEFDSRRAAEAFVAPDWFGPEVTQDHRYLNSELARSGKVPTRS